MLELRPQEETFDLKPIGIRYRCEFCNEGEMRYDNTVDTLTWGSQAPTMYTHKCDKCGKTMILPKMYPYIEWIPTEEDQKDNN